MNQLKMFLVSYRPKDLFVLPGKRVMREMTFPSDARKTSDGSDRINQAHNNTRRVGLRRSFEVELRSSRVFHRPWTRDRNRFYRVAGERDWCFIAMHSR